VLGGAGRGGSPCDNHVHLEPDQLVRQVAEPLETPLRVAGLNDEVLALDIAEVVQTLPQGLQLWIECRGDEGWARSEPNDPCTFVGCCASAASGATRRARATMTMNPIARSRMVESSTIPVRSPWVSRGVHPSVDPGEVGLLAMLRRLLWTGGDESYRTPLCH